MCSMSRAYGGMQQIQQFCLRHHTHRSVEVLVLGVCAHKPRPRLSLPLFVHACMCIGRDFAITCTTSETKPMRVASLQTSPGWVCSSCLSTAIGQATARRLGLGTSQAYRRSFTASTRRTRNDKARDGKLPDYSVRTRFAPSPTGYMHIGGLRTALFSYLLAKRTGGQFILRIEDTDQKRFVEGAVDRLCEDLQWAGLQWDEGPNVGGPYGPYQQSERNEIYRRHAHDLLEEGTAYRCFCTPQTAGAGSAAFVTSGCYQDCSHLSSFESYARADSGGQRFTVRLKQPENVHKRTYPDLIYGNIKRLKRSPGVSAADGEESGLDAADTILLKSDGTPTYHFANVVDDHLMKITHVIRGTEWMASTPLHYDLYTAFGWKPPVFAHVGLLLDKDKAKLSKRNADLALDVRGLREDHGVLPETLCNFLALQGWSNPNKNDVMTMDELAQNFDLKFTRGNTMVLMEKLWFLQKSHVQRLCEETRNGRNKRAIQPVLDKIVPEVERRYPDLASTLPLSSQKISVATYCRNILLADSASYQTAAQFVDRNWYFFAYEPAASEPDATAKPSDPNQVTLSQLQDLVQALLTSIDPEKPYTNPAYPKPIASASPSEVAHAKPPTDLERASARIHAYLNHEIWQRCAHSTSAELPFTDQPVDIAATARALGDEAEVLKQYRDWQKASMRCLREKLSAGTPGPGVGMLMAVLGYEECCRRLGVAPVEGKGW